MIGHTARPIDAHENHCSDQCGAIEICSCSSPFDHPCAACQLQRDWWVEAQERRLTAIDPVAPWLAGLRSES